eukprot:TRINITY_DN1268_c0_g1_i1.p1 TRINITY_DN1268_c0_g1~~TRINITY_DN1268_c0_g1_i1.p1  ORF type:complete len:635 (+),score=104.43 TRINITY_DN1268_c0_g1_i1:6337-8241(+)
MLSMRTRCCCSCCARMAAPHYRATARRLVHHGKHDEARVQYLYASCNFVALCQRLSDVDAAMTRSCQAHHATTCSLTAPAPLRRARSAPPVALRSGTSALLIPPHVCHFSFGARVRSFVTCTTSIARIPSSMCAFRLFAYLLLASLIPAALASCVTPTPSPGSSPSPPPSPTPPPPLWYNGRYFFYSADAPIGTALRKVNGFVDAVDAAIDLLESVESTIVKEQQFRLTAKQLNLAFREPHICNLEDDEWRSSARDQLIVRGVPVQNITESRMLSCITDFVFPDDADELLMRDTVETISHKLSDAARNISVAANSNFSNPDAIYNWPLSTKTEDCHINVLGAFRVLSEWFLNIGITNEHQQNHVPENARQYLNENIGRGSVSGGLRLFVRPEDDAVNQTHVQTDATTMIVTHRGVAAPGVFKNIPLEENLAVVRALDKANLLSQQVSDALSPSSIAILVLPLALNLIPIALLADVGTKGTLIYAMLSDVITVIPLGIKGIELISIGSDVFYGSVLRMSSSSSGEVADLGAAEVYVARCVSKHNVLPTGIAFLTLSIVFMVLGLVGDVVAKRYAVRHRRRLYGRISLSSSRSSSEWSARARSRSDSASLMEARGAEHFGMELDAYDTEGNEDHRL